MRFAAFLLLLVLTGAAHACRFAKDAGPAQWDEWSSALFAAHVEGLEHDDKNSLDVIRLRIVETFKGPPGASATLRIPKRMWRSCNLERPAVGARVLAALNPNGDALVVPLPEAYRERLRERKR